MEPTRCPHPEKHRHSSRRAAEKALAAFDRTGRADPALRPYKCGDHWHLGHRSGGSIETQLKRALKLGRKRRTRYQR